MGLTDEQVRKIYKYLRVPQITQHGSVLSGTPVLTAFVHVVQTAVNQLTTGGEATVIECLSALDAITAGLTAATAGLGIKRVKGGSSEVEYADGEGGFAARTAQQDHWRSELAHVLGVPLDQLLMCGAREP